VRVATRSIEAQSSSRRSLAAGLLINRSGPGRIDESLTMTVAVLVGSFKAEGGRWQPAEGLFDYLSTMAPRASTSRVEAPRSLALAIRPPAKTV